MPCSDSRGQKSLPLLFILLG